TTPADGHPPCSAYMPSAAVAPISSQGRPASSRWLIRSRANIFPLACCFSPALAPPPWYTFFNRFLSADTACLFKSSFWLNSRFIMVDKIRHSFLSLYFFTFLGYLSVH